MTPTEITLQVVHNLGNYESVRLECRYTLATGDELIKSFVRARAELDKAFATAYGKNPVHDETESQPQPRTELTVNSKEFDRVCRALAEKKTNLTELEKYFKISKDAIDYFRKYNLI